MSEGDLLRQVCCDYSVPESTVRQWVRDDRESFAAHYQAARGLQVESWSNKIIELANRDDLEPNDKRVGDGDFTKGRAFMYRLVRDLRARHRRATGRR